jgi:hypothetical protein
MPSQIAGLIPTLDPTCNPVHCVIDEARPFSAICSGRSPALTVLSAFHDATDNKELTGPAVGRDARSQALVGKGGSSINGPSPKMTPIRSYSIVAARRATECGASTFALETKRYEHSYGAFLADDR